MAATAVRAECNNAVFQGISPRIAMRLAEVFISVTPLRRTNAFRPVCEIVNSSAE
jgi:hypothetical protein